MGEQPMLTSPFVVLFWQVTALLSPDSLRMWPVMNSLLVPVSAWAVPPRAMDRAAMAVAQAARRLVVTGVLLRVVRTVQQDNEAAGRRCRSALPRVCPRVRGVLAARGTRHPAQHYRLGTVSRIS